MFIGRLIKFSKEELISLADAFGLMLVFETSDADSEILF